MRLWRWSWRRTGGHGSSNRIESFRSFLAAWRHSPASPFKASSTSAYKHIYGRRPLEFILSLKFPFHTAPSYDMAAPGVLNAISKYAIPVFIGISVGQAALYDVKGGTRAVIFDRLSGVQEKVINEGTHFLVPWLQKAIIYDVRTKPRNISTTTGSKDLQMVSLTLRVLHRPEVQMLPKIYQVRQEEKR